MLTFREQSIYSEVFNDMFAGLLEYEESSSTLPLATLPSPRNITQAFP
jgi:hypothetical protein